MRGWAGFALWYAAAALAADPDAFERAQRLVATGTPQLAFDFIVKTQPADPGAARWSDWEALRCALLVRLNRSRELLERAERLPPGAAAVALRECLMPAARAAIVSGQAATARRHAVRLLWQGTPSAEDTREIRLLVIDSYVADRQSADAYHSMLRFDLDHRPLERQTAARFVSGLLDLGLPKEAVNWLAHLDDSDPLKLMLRLQAGLIEPDTALKLARALAAKAPGAGWWGVAARAAQMQGGRAFQIEALEQLLQHAVAGDASLATRVRELWQTYVAAAREAAGRNHLLENDDAGWGAYAASRIGNEPIMARAAFAYLARRANASEARGNAQLQLELSLQIAKLDVAALRLFSDEEIAVSSLDPRLRYSLGSLAEKRGLHAATVRMWHGLAPPPGNAAVEWQLRLVASMMRAGQADAGTVLLQQAAAAKEPWPPEAVKRAAVLSRELLNAGHSRTAEPLLAGLVQRTDGLERRQFLFDLGRVNDADGKPAAAAEHYLRCAALIEPKPADPLARQARLAAGLSLAQAGYRDDARAQFEWVLRNSRDPVQLDVARRELKKL